MFPVNHSLFVEAACSFEMLIDLAQYIVLKYNGKNVPSMSPWLSCCIVYYTLCLIEHWLDDIGCDYCNHCFFTMKLVYHLLFCL